MNATPGLEALARGCHALWCERMLAEGWRPGERYDQDAKIHSALQPFDRLHPLDQREALMAAERLAPHATFECSMCRPRGANREFTALDITVGLRVALCDSLTGELVEPLTEGSVISWVAEPDAPFLDRVTVRWDDGEVVEYCPSECVLARVENIPPDPVSAPGSQSTLSS